MGRPLRLHLPGGFYHTTLRGNHREVIFTVDSDRGLLNTIVEAALAKHGARVHAYCWMTNHLHMLVQVGDEPLAGLMRRIASGYARAYQSNRETTGRLFEKRYHAVLVDADAYLMELVRYIHLNPVRAGLVNSPHQYRWSSHHAYLGAPCDRWVSTDFALQMFSRDRAKAIAAYRAFVDCNAADIVSPLEHVRTERPEILGGDAFCERVCRELKLPSAKQSLESLIAEGCAQFGLARHQLISELRNERIAAARSWIARRAIEGRVSTIAEIARVVGCAPKTIRRAMRQHTEDHV